MSPKAPEGDLFQKGHLLNPRGRFGLVLGVRQSSFLVIKLGADSSFVGETCR